MIKKLLLIFVFLVFTFCSQAQNYRASYFGIESNGTTLNTTSIQKAIDFIHKKGGGKLIFDVGRYVTGSIYLKSNVTIQLNEGAVLVGALNPFDYDKHGWWTSLIFALNQENIGITGKGVVDGRGYQVAQNVLNMIHRGIIEDEKLSNDRPSERLRPHNIYFKECKNVIIKGITIKNPASWNQQYDQCKNVVIENITGDSKNYWNNDGIDIVDCDSVIVKNSYFDASDDGICLKSHSPKFLCQNIEIYNNTVRSSASAIKLGTASKGGFKNIRIVNNKVYDTYRSAITLATVDGGILENVVVDSLIARNVGNAIFLRIGKRWTKKNGTMNNITLSNIYAEIPATKPDAGYSYEGPIEHQPRNISPAAIVGLSDAAIENVILKNIEIHYTGGGDSLFAKVDVSELDQIPELPKSYPEFSMFKELPAWGFYIRHAKNLIFENVKLYCEKEDYRIAIVLDDVNQAIFDNVKIHERSNQKETIFSHQSSHILIK